MLSPKLGLAGGDIGVGFHIVQHGLQPTRRRLDIGVQKEIIVIALSNSAQCLIISVGETIVTVETNHFNLRELRC
jgi:hypothetical protein